MRPRSRRSGATTCFETSFKAAPAAMAADAVEQIVLVLRQQALEAPPGEQRRLAESLGPRPEGFAGAPIVRRGGGHRHLPPVRLDDREGFLDAVPGHLDRGGRPGCRGCHRLLLLPVKLGGPARSLAHVRIATSGGLAGALRWKGLLFPITVQITARWNSSGGPAVTGPIGAWVGNGLRWRLGSVDRRSEPEDDLLEAAVHVLDLVGKDGPGFPEPPELLLGDPALRRCSPGELVSLDPGLRQDPGGVPARLLPDPLSRLLGRSEDLRGLLPELAEERCGIPRPAGGGRGGAGRGPGRRGFVRIHGSQAHRSARRAGPSSGPSSREAYPTAPPGPRLSGQIGSAPTCPRTTTRRARA